MMDGVHQRMEQENKSYWYNRNYSIGNKRIRNVLSEFFGTALLLLIGDCIVAQYVLTPSNETRTQLSMHIGWGLAVAIAVQVCAKVSGGHLNPAVSLVLFTFGQLPFVDLLLYSIAQTCGAFVGSALTYFVYYDAINNFDGGNRQVYGDKGTAGIFATYPKSYLSIQNALLDQMVGTAILCLIVAVVTDDRNRIPTFVRPYCFGACITVIGLGFCMNAGYAINPARDLGPRIFTSIVGYGWEVFSYNNYEWFWIPLIGPLIGGLIGAWLYRLCIGWHITSTNDNRRQGETSTIAADDVENMNETGRLVVCC